MQIQEMAGSSSHLHHGLRQSFILDLYQSAYPNAAFLPPSHVLCFLQNPPLLFFLSHAMPPPAASPPGGSESGRSTPSLSTYSDGKSPSSASTYVAAPRHFHIPGRPRLCSLGCGSAFSFSSHLCTGCHWRSSRRNCKAKMPC